MKNLKSFGVQELNAKEIKSTDGGWHGARMSSVDWSSVTDGFIDAGQWVLGLFAGISDGINDGMKEG